MLKKKLLIIISIIILFTISLFSYYKYKKYKNYYVNVNNFFHQLFEISHHQDCNKIIKKTNKKLNKKIIVKYSDIISFHLANCVLSGQIPLEQINSVNSSIQDRTFKQLKAMKDLSILQEAKEVILPPIIQKNHLESTVGYNASIVKYKDGFITAYNYNLKEKQSSEKPDDYNVYGVNKALDVVIAKLTKDMKIIGKPLSLYNKLQTAYTESALIGDPRIFIFKNKIYVIYLAYPSTYFLKTCCIANQSLYLAEIEEKEDTFVLKNNIRLFYPEKISVTEKNWAPLIRNDELYLLLSPGPDTILLKPNLKTGECKLFSRSHFDIDLYPFLDHGLSSFHNGSGLIEIASDTYISIIHTHVKHGGRTRQYYIFPLVYKWKNDTLYAEKISRYPILSSFIYRLGMNINHMGVIFPAGLFLDKNNVNIVAGINDSTTFILKLHLDKLNKDIEWLTLK